MAKVRIGAIDKNLANKAKKYKELTGISTVTLVENLLTEFFKDIKLRNDYINIDKIYYFSLKKLLNEGEVKATKNKLSETLKDTYIIKKIPNNLDEFDKNHNTFCYNKIPEKHLGIYSYNSFKSNSKFKDTELLQYYILFDYNDKTEEILLKLIDLNDIKLLVDLNKISNILDDLTEYNNIFKNELERIKKMPESEKIPKELTNPLFEFDNPLIYLGSTTVIESYTNAKKISKTIHKLDSNMYNKFKGMYGSDDLIIFREGKLIKNEDLENIKIIDNKYSNNELNF